MKNVRKFCKAVSLLLSVSLLFGASILFPVSAEEIYQCTDGFTATFVPASGTLTISGSGAMQDYGFYKRPVWYGFHEDVKKIVVEEGVTALGSYAFCGMTAAAEISLPQSLKSAGNYAFYSCTSLKEMSFPEEMEAIGEYALAECSALTTLRFPKKLSSISWGTAFRCQYLVNVVLPESCPIIENEAFYFCNRATAYTLPSDLEYIGDNAFYQNASISELVFPETLKYIGETALTTMKISEFDFPPSLENIGYNALYATSWYKAQSNGLHLINGITITYKGSPTETEIAIPEGAVRISSKTLADFKSVTDVVIPDTVTTIEADAFYNMASLQRITIPKSVTSIGERAFGYVMKETGEIVPVDFTVYSFAGSAAEEFAEKNGFKFVCIHEEGAPVRKNCAIEETVSVPCIHCKKTLYKTTVAATGHSFGPEISVDMTCTENGKTSIVCAVCGLEEILGETEAPGHKVSEEFEIDKMPTCSEAGSVSKKCTVCNEKIEELILEPAAHTPTGDFETVKEATCIESGLEAIFCGVCNQYAETRTTDPVGHTDGEWLVLTAPKPCYYGFKVMFCKTCQNIIREEKFEGSFERGDLDGNGRITNNDVLILRKILALAEDPEIVPKSGDTDGNGRITNGDILTLRKIIAGEE